MKRHKRLTCFITATIFLGTAAISTGADPSSVKISPHGKQIFLSEVEKTSLKANVSAYFPKLSYKFKPVVEGVKVIHDFVVQNKGADVLKIDNVKTGWGCSVASYPRQIPAGGEGKIRIQVNTSGYGGRAVHKTIVVNTNDPKQPKISLTIGGEVKKFAEINPKFVRLTGEVGELLEQDITIVPEPDFPFKIKKIKAKKDEFIKYSLLKPESKDGTKYRLHVENTKSEVGRYSDYIQLYTDSDIQPVLNIGVYGYIKAKSSKALKRKIFGQ